jgi:hypothetical protein
MKTASIRHLFQAAAVSAAGLWLVGCGTTYVVKVDAISQPDAPEAVSYRIHDKTAAYGEEQDLRNREAVEYVRTALSGRGYYEAPSLEMAEMVIELDYGVSAPRVRYDTRNEPVVARVGGGLVYQQVPVRDSRGNVTYQTVVTYEPSRLETIGYREVAVPRTVYEKYLRLSARENIPDQEGRPAPQIWSVHVTNEDESNDIRKYLPILASASIDYLGADSGTQRTVKVKEKDADVAFVRQGGI